VESWGGASFWLGPKAAKNRSSPKALRALMTWLGFGSSVREVDARFARIGSQRGGRALAFHDSQPRVGNPFHFLAVVISNCGLIMAHFSGNTRKDFFAGSRLSGKCEIIG
jgi:hypothetical protein